MSFFNNLCVLTVVSVIAVAVVAEPAGPYKNIQHATYTDKELDASDRQLDVVWPVGAEGQKFPFIGFAHGFTDSGYSSYKDLFDDLASWGYVIGVALGCKEGCISDCKNEFLDPPCFGHYYKQQLHVIDWSRTAAANKLPINLTCGAGVAGHSMGGQATLFSAAYNASTQNIKAAAMLHAFTHTYPAITNVPFLTFTGTEDTTAPPEMAQKVFDATGASSVRGIINKIGANHHEPSSQYNPKLGLYTVAWFKIFLDQTPQALGMDFESLIFGNGTSSVCNGGDGSMKECTILR